MVPKYKYHLRPAYGRSYLLIEIYHGVKEESFISDFLQAVSYLKPELPESNDFYINDEIMFDINSTVGVFSISKDIWKIAFVTAEHNQDALKIIDALLAKSLIFEKVVVNFEDYQLGKKPSVT